MGVITLSRNPRFWAPLCVLLMLSLYSGFFWSRQFPTPQNLSVQGSQWLGQEVAFLYCRYAGTTEHGILLSHPEGMLSVRGSIPDPMPGVRVSVVLFVGASGELVLRRWQIHEDRSAKAWISMIGLLGALGYILKSLRWSRKGPGICPI